MGSFSAMLPLLALWSAIIAGKSSTSRLKAGSHPAQALLRDDPHTGFWNRTNATRTWPPDNATVAVPRAIRAHDPAASANMSTARRVEKKTPTSDKACSRTPDCPEGQYCDFGHSCFQCSYLTEKCDALGGDCCSATFLKNCPSNPLRRLCNPCETALVKACNSSRDNVFDCAQCSGVHQHDLMAASCTNGQISRWCSGLPLVGPCSDIEVNRQGSCSTGRRLISRARAQECNSEICHKMHSWHILTLEDGRMAGPGYHCEVADGAGSGSVCE